MVAGLISAISCIGRVTVLERVSYHILPSSAKFYRWGRWNIVEIKTVETGGRVHGVPAMFCHILPGFYHILPTGQVEYSGG